MILPPTRKSGVSKWLLSSAPGSDRASARASSAVMGRDLHMDRQMNRERRALAVDTLDSQVAAHQSTEVPADRQPEASPAVLAARRCLGLGERLEQAPELLLRHPDPRVRHRERDVLPLPLGEGWGEG